jgi:7,8-dihydropterin-6-yl-methyl-4-(beta-D-ribofuranosyl)aminobenzene 5'-phosphate synthase
VAESTPTIRSVRITVLVENLTDMLLTDDESRRISRFGLIQHFEPPHGSVICTENGISYWIEVGDEHVILFDTGLTGMPLLHNMSALGLEPERIDSVVLSHGHPDHFGGLTKLLGKLTAPTPIVVHPDAFLPKYFLDEEGRPFLHVNKGLERDGIESAGGSVRHAKGPVEVVPGVLATGQIPRVVPFEPPVPIRTGREGLYLERDGTLENDDGTIDDQAVVINVEGEGLIVVTACGHSGIVNTVRYAQEITGVNEIVAIMGGFHLGFPGVPDENVDPTVEALKGFAPRMIAPMHCSGFAAQAAVAEALPDAFVQNVVGTSIVFGR